MKTFEAYKKSSSRLLLFYPLFGLLFLVLITGLFWRQIIQNTFYEEKEERQTLRRVIQPGPRGDIFDREGRLLVGNLPRFSAMIFLNELRGELRKEYFKKVREIRDKGGNFNRDAVKKEARIAVLQKYLDQINAIIGKEATISAKDLERHFTQRLLLPFSLIDNLSEDEFAKLTEQLPVESPIQIYADSIRYYPYGSAASHILGYVSATQEVPDTGLPGEKLTTFNFKGKSGKHGLELSFEKHLQGQSGGEIWRVDPVGFQYQCLAKKEPIQGEKLTTTIDIDLQIEAEKALGNKVGSVILMDVKTGEILAMASKPDYNLNDFSPSISQKTYAEISEKGAWLNRSTQGLYPPGSPFKLITAIAALRAKAIESDEEIDCAAFFDVGNRPFPEHSRQPFGPTDLPRALAVSSNVYFYDSALRIGIDKLSKEAKRFGLGQKTGVELPYEEKRSLVPTPAWKKQTIKEGWWDGDTANMSIGQGFLLATPLQMATFTASLARNETRTIPTLIPQRNRRNKDHGGVPIGLPDKDYQAILDGMERAVNEGTARLTRLPGIRIGAKTGTSQVRHHGQKLTLAWILGFAPLENPEVAITVMVEGVDPNDRYWGGTTAAPIARSVFRAYFKKRGQVSS